MIVDLTEIFKSIKASVEKVSGMFRQKIAKRILADVNFPIAYWISLEMHQFFCNTSRKLYEYKTPIYYYITYPDASMMDIRTGVELFNMGI